MKKIIIGIGVMLVGYMGCASLSTNSSESAKMTAAKDADIIPAKISDPTDQREKMRSITSSKSEKDTGTKSMKREFDDVFKYVDVDEMKMTVASKRGVKPLSAFTLPKGTIKNLKIGDEITLPEIDEQTYVVTVVDHTVNANQSVTVKAYVEGESARYYSMMTEGENNAFVTLNSSEGVYEMEIVNGNGYVYSANDIRKAWIDPSKTDEVAVPRALIK